MNYCLCYINDGEIVIAEDDLILNNTKISEVLIQNDYHFNKINYDAIIFIANSKFFYKLKYLHFIIEKFRPIAGLDKSNENTINPENYYPKPIITVFSSKAFKDSPNRSIHFGLQYFDSSIWQRWIDITSDTYLENLNDTTKEIRQNHENRLYCDNGSKEFCEYKTRVYYNSYLINLSNSEQGHAKYITPFPFFQESYFKKDLQKLKKELPIGLKFRVLFVDDDYIQNRIEKIETLLKENLPEITFVIEKAKDISEAESELRSSNKIFDLLFLDYLLGEKNGVKHNLREKGIDLLNSIHSDTKDELFSYQRGVLNTFWILLTTSFPQAFLDDVRQKGFSLYTQYWVIERGGSPLYSPYSFLYSLLIFINSQIKAIKPTDSISKLWKDALTKLVNQDIKDDKKFTRGWANNTLTKILDYWRKIESLKEIRGDMNKEDGSLFAKSYLNSQIYIKTKEEYDNGLYGYLTHLLFMLSFSDGYEWEEMKTNLERIKILVPEFQESLNGNHTGYEILNQRILKLKETFDGK